MVGQELRHGPVHVGRRTPAETMGRKARFPHLRRQDEDLKLDGQGARRLIAVAPQIGQGLGIDRGPRRLGTAKRRHGFRCDDPGRDGGQEVLGQERAEGLVFPGLQVSGGPVVEKAEAGDVILGVFDGNGVAEGVALADPDTEFQLVIEAAAGAKAWRVVVRVLALAAWTDHRLARGPNGRCAAVVSDRHVFVIRQERVVGSELTPDVQGVMYPDVKIGVVADPRGQVQGALVRPVQHGAQGLRVIVLAEEGAKVEAKLAPGGGQKAEQAVQRLALQHGRRKVGQDARFRRSVKVEDVVADGRPRPRPPAGGAENAQWQILDGEVRMRVRALDPAGSRRVVRFVDQRHGCGFAF